MMNYWHAGAFMPNCSSSRQRDIAEALVNSTFDATATRFEQYRALPVGVPQAIRQSTGAPPSARVLDLGAGSGRIGRAFVEAGDSYVGADFSLPMLREFRARRTAGLLQADGGCLPFPDGCF